MVIGIGGISRSGKTTLASLLSNYFSNDRTCSVLHLDRYLANWDEAPLIRNTIDWEHPISIDFTRLENDIKKCVEASEIIIAEGFLIYYKESISALFDKKIYLSIDKECFLKRRLRDYIEPLWYVDHVWDSYQDRHSKFKVSCDIKLNGQEKIVLAEVIRKLGC